MSRQQFIESTPNFTEWFFEFNRERLKHEAALGIHMLMEQYDPELSRAELAQKLREAKGKENPKTSRSWVTKFLSGYHNFTLETLADVCAILGRSVHLRFSNSFDHLLVPLDDCEFEHPPFKLREFADLSAANPAVDISYGSSVPPTVQIGTG